MNTTRKTYVYIDRSPLRLVTPFPEICKQKPKVNRRRDRFTSMPQPLGDLAVAAWCIGHRPCFLELRQHWCTADASCNCITRRYPHGRCRCTGRDIVLEIINTGPCSALRAGYERVPSKIISTSRICLYFHTGLCRSRDLHTLPSVVLGTIMRLTIIVRLYSLIMAQNRLMTNDEVVPHSLTN